MEFLVPFFLVNIGMQLQLSVFRDWTLVWLALAVTLVALVTKLIGCAAGAWSLGLKRAAQVGVGMMPRGEVGIVVAQIGLSLGVIDARLYAVVLFMAVATTLIAPPLLIVLFKADASR
jgi:Kef-type K+ transport system membrane component KefB